MTEPVDLLIIESHATVRAALAHRLQRSPGIRVVGAVANVAEALHLSSQVAPDVVLYEPRGSQMEPRCALGALAAAGQTVVVWTSSLVPGETETLLRAGAAAVLLKDTDMQGLLQAIRTARGAAPATGQIQLPQVPVAQTE